MTTLREMIVSRRFAAGERLAEIPVAEALGVSRTPVRLAFRTLEQEGLLERVGKRGLAVRAFSDADVRCALEVRGALEGLAARALAERGLTGPESQRLRDCLAAGEAVVSKGWLDDGDVAAWASLNDVFHRTIVDGAGSRVIADALSRNDHLPFASATSIVIDPNAMDREWRKLEFAQLHHRLVVDALEARESARVEMLMREHAYVGLRYGRLFGLSAIDAPRAADGGPAAQAR
ncbi:MAG: GntR family transcriptional regulator [Lautropia sp.]